VETNWGIMDMGLKHDMAQDTGTARRHSPTLERGELERLED
jgi:hypothetical protein